MAKLAQKPSDDFFFHRRVNYLTVFIAIVFAIIFFRVSFLQIIKGNEYKILAKDNHEQYVPIPAYRGEIYDRNFDVPLVSNKQSLNVYMIPARIPDKDFQKVLKKLSLLINVSVEDIFFEYSSKYRNPYDPFLIKKNINLSELVKIAEYSTELPGIYWEDNPFRIYNFGPLASHVIGYVGPISTDELDQKIEGDYNINSIVGKGGVESYYDRELRGVEGKQLHIVDAKHRIKSSTIESKPAAGDTIVLTIDRRTQEIVEEAIKGYVGCAIVVSPYSGEVLALASSPTFDPRIFIGEIDNEKFTKLVENKDRPFMNRAIQAKYPPSSIFKIVTATAGLEEEIITTENTFLCNGYYKFENDDRIFHCWGTHYWTHIFKAIALSCNVYFFNVGYELGSEKIARFARNYGLGIKSGIDLPGEVEGFIPSAKWKKMKFDENWYDGDTINMAIGQGFTLVTPMQITDIMCAVANGGLIYKPHVVKEFYSSETKKLKSTIKPEIIYNIPIRDENLNIIRQGLRGVMTYGTGKVCNSVTRIAIAGKTGTAQFTRGDPHSWFSGYAPCFDYPKIKQEDRIVVTVLLEHAGGGGEVATPIGASIIESYFLKTDIKETKRRILGKVQADSYRRFLLRKQKKEGEEPIETDDIRF